MILLRLVSEFRTEGALNITFNPLAASCTPDNAEYGICIIFIH